MPISLHCTVRCWLTFERGPARLSLNPMRKRHLQEKSSPGPAAQIRAESRTTDKKWTKLLVKRQELSLIECYRAKLCIICSSQLPVILFLNCWSQWSRLLLLGLMILEISQFLSATNHIHSHEDCVCDWLDYASVYIFDSIKITCMFYWKRAKSCDCDLHLHDHVFPTYVLPKPTEHFPGLLFAANVCNQNAKLIFAYVVYEKNNNQAFLYKIFFFFLCKSFKIRKILGIKIFSTKAENSGVKGCGCLLFRSYIHMHATFLYNMVFQMSGPLFTQQETCSRVVPKTPGIIRERQKCILLAELLQQITVLNRNRRRGQTWGWCFTMKIITTWYRRKKKSQMSPKEQCWVL